MAFWRGIHGAALSERLTEAEVRLSRLAEAVHEKAERVEACEAAVRRVQESQAAIQASLAALDAGVRGIQERDVARLAAVIDATDKLARVVERWRKGGPTGDSSDAGDEAYLRLAEARRSALGIGNGG